MDEDEEAEFRRLGRSSSTASAKFQAPRVKYSGRKTLVFFGRVGDRRKRPRLRAAGGRFPVDRARSFADGSRPTVEARSHGSEAEAGSHRA